MSSPRRPVHGPETASLAVPPAPSPGVLLSRPSTDVLRVRFRGWTAELRGSAVVVPEQQYTRGSDLTDLISCVAIAQAYTPRPMERTAAPADTRQDTTCAGSTWQAAAVVLRGAQHATRAWDRRYCDIYACLNRSWANHGYAEAYTALTVPLRHLVERGNLLDFNDTHFGAEVVTLFNRAAERVEQRGIRKPSRGAA